MPFFDVLDLFFPSSDKKFRYAFASVIRTQLLTYPDFSLHFLAFSSSIKPIVFLLRHIITLEHTYTNTNKFTLKNPKLNDKVKSIWLSVGNVAFQELSTTPPHPNGCSYCRNSHRTCVMELVRVCVDFVASKVLAEMFNSARVIQISF